jgi:hypothetical protein
MDDRESRELFRAGLLNQQLPEYEETTTKILKLLANLPLAIMQAVSCLNAKSTTIDMYVS